MIEILSIKWANILVHRLLFNIPTLITDNLLIVVSAGVLIIRFLLNRRIKK